MPNSEFTAQDVADRRQWSRFSLPVPELSTLTVDGEDYHCLVEDISLGGARLRCLAAVPPPTTMRFRHPSAGEFQADCKWHDGDRVGLEFDHSHAALLMVSHCVKRILPGASAGSGASES